MWWVISGDQGTIYLNRYCALSFLWLFYFTVVFYSDPALRSLDDKYRHKYNPSNMRSRTRSASVWRKSQETQATFKGERRANLKGVDVCVRGRDHLPDITVESHGVWRLSYTTSLKYVLCLLDVCWRFLKLECLFMFWILWKLWNGITGKMHVFLSGKKLQCKQHTCDNVFEMIGYLMVAKQNSLWCLVRLLFPWAERILLIWSGSHLVELMCLNERGSA